MEPWVLLLAVCSMLGLSRHAATASSCKVVAGCVASILALCGFIFWSVAPSGGWDKAIVPTVCQEWASTRPYSDKAAVRHWCYQVSSPPDYAAVY